MPPSGVYRRRTLLPVRFGVRRGLRDVEAKIERAHSRAVSLGGALVARSMGSAECCSIAPRRLTSRIVHGERILHS